MHLVRNESSGSETALFDAAAADQYARMMQELIMDIDELDPVAFPPDRRFILRDKEAWIYEHGNICELVYVRVDCEAEWE
ncbi:MAG: hypothetical protein KDJ66_07120 [Nitratireductor sp.]|nr:hypothetical protein [Nitratireductor sp.]